MSEPLPPGSSQSDVRSAFTAFYDSLRRKARQVLAASGGQPSLTPTDLAHEAFGKLVCEEVRRRNAGRTELGTKQEPAFKACFAAACRDILVDRVRRRRTQKRGRGQAHREVDDDSLIGRDQELDMLALHDELRALAGSGEDLERLVEMHVFGGMTLPECAAALSVSESTAQRSLKFAKAQLADRWRRLRSDA